MHACVCVSVCVNPSTDRKSADHNEVCLLQPKGALPVNDHNPHDPKVPYAEGPGQPVQSKVVHHTNVTEWGGGVLVQADQAAAGGGAVGGRGMGCAHSQEVEGGKEEEEEHRHHQQPGVDNL